MTLTAFVNQFSTKLDQWYLGKGDFTPASPFHRHFTIRLAHPLAFALRILSTPLDAAVGCLSMPLTLLTLGRDENCYRFTKAQLQAPRLLLPGLFKSSINTIAPSLLSGFIAPKVNNGFRCGLMGTFVRGTMLEGIKENLESDSFFKKHIVTRILITCETAAILVGRIIDMAISIFCAIGVVLGTFFFRDKLKDLCLYSFVSLQVFGIGEDLFSWVARTLNPLIDKKALVDQTDSPVNSDEE